MTAVEVLRWKANDPVLARMSAVDREKYASLVSASHIAAKEAHEMWMAARGKDSK